MGQNATVAVGDVFFCGQHPVRVMAIKAGKVRLHSLTEGVHLTRTKPVIHAEITTPAGKETLTFSVEEE